jgi:hypothetical protein
VSGGLGGGAVVRQGQLAVVRLCVCRHLAPCFFTCCNARGHHAHTHPCARMLWAPHSCAHARPHVCKHQPAPVLTHATQCPSPTLHLPHPTPYVTLAHCPLPSRRHLLLPSPADCHAIRVGRRGGSAGGVSGHLPRCADVPCGHCSCGRGYPPLQVGWREGSGVAWVARG